MSLLAQRPWLLVAGSLVLGVAIVAAPLVAVAQSPSPTQYVENIDPKTPPNPLAPLPGSIGIVVEGLSIPTGPSSYCANYPSQPQDESVSVNSIADSYPTLTEITLDSGCGTIAQYETYVQQILTYIQQNTTTSQRDTYFKGFLFDEESAYGFTASQVQSFNQWANTVLAGAGGITYPVSELFVGQGDWTQPQFNAALENTIAAPQVANTSMVSYTNTFVADTGHIVGVTFGTAAEGYSWTTLSTASAQIHGTPWYQWGYYLGNYFSAS